MGFAWGLVGFADFVDGYYTTIDPKSQRFEPKTIDPKNQRFKPTMTMHYSTTIDQKTLKDSTHDHALQHH
jgi:hypothetical protein